MTMHELSLGAVILQAEAPLQVDRADVARLVERSLAGLRLEESVGHTFEIPTGNGLISAKVVCLSSVTGNGGASRPQAMARAGAAPEEIREALGDYASLIEVHSPRSGEYEDALQQVTALVGVPSEEFLDELAAIFADHSTTSMWEARHYGGRFPVEQVLRSALPVLLLAGDPGTGKTALVHRALPVLAHELGRQVLFVQLSERLRGSGIQGRAGAELVGVIDRLGQLASTHDLPTVVFIDEADAVVSVRTGQDFGSGAQENVALVDAVIVAFDRAADVRRGQIAFVLVTNLLDRIDPAVRRRARVLQFNRPSADERLEFLAGVLSAALSASELDLVNGALERSELPLTVADVLRQVVVPAVRRALADDRPIDPAEVVAFAQSAVATPLPQPNPSSRPRPLRARDSRRGTAPRLRSG